MYQLTSDPNMVINIETSSLVTAGNYLWDQYQAWLAAGNKPQAQPAPTFADYVQIFLPALSTWMEDVAHSNQYDSVLSCISYLDSTVAQYKADAQAMLAWRDALWVWAAGWEAGFNGQVPATIPTIDQVKAQAPQPEAFNWVVHATGNVVTGTQTAGKAGL
jgi:hypothetical protein